MSYTCEDCGYLSLGSDDHHNCLTVLQDEVKELKRQRDGYIKESNEVEQSLGQALGYYPWYKDDPKNFPDATEADGVCVGEHTPGTIAAEAAAYIIRLRETSENNS
jgi:hypothetical protein